MAVKNKKNLKVDLDRLTRNRVVVICFVAIALVGLFVFSILSNYNLVPRKDHDLQANLSVTNNRACLWVDLTKVQSQLGKQFEKIGANGGYNGRFIHDGVNLPLAQHSCDLANENYSLGVMANFFENDHHAADYASKVLNSDRYWSEGGDFEDREGIFTFVIIEDGGRGRAERVDAYTVKESVVLRFSVPCASQDKYANDPGQCDALAVDIIKGVLEQAQNNRDSIPLNPVKR